MLTDVSDGQPYKFIYFKKLLAKLRSISLGATICISVIELFSALRVYNKGSEEYTKPLKYSRILESRLSNFSFYAFIIDILLILL